MQNILSTGHLYGVKHLKCEKVTPLSDFLSEQLSLKSSETQSLLNLGAIYINEKRAPKDVLSAPLNQQDYIRVHTQPRRFPILLAAEALAKQSLIRFAHEDFYIVHKPSGIPVHPTVDNTQENLLAFLERELQEKLYITHRLDVPTSGLLMIARNEAAQKEFNRLLSESRVQKIYKALVHGLYQGPSLLTHFMEPSPRAPKIVRSEKPPGGLTCQLEVLESEVMSPQRSLLKIRLLTGRTHQIRAQLSYVGHPIVGDKSYGSPVVFDENIADKIALTASFLSFEWRDSTLHFKAEE